MEVDVIASRSKSFSGIDNNRWPMAIDKHKIFVHRFVTGFQYQSINCYRLLSTAFDCYRLSVFIQSK